MIIAAQCIAGSQDGSAEEGVGNFTIEIEVKVNTPELLYKAARAHKEGIDATHLRLGNGEVNVEDCLTMVTDPTIVSGFEVTQSTATPVDGNPGEFEVEIKVRVFDPKALLEAALKHPDNEGVPEEESGLNDDDFIDVEKCLHMLLDPGYVPGCTLHESHVNHDSGYDACW
jgi:hypothetical protein